MKKTMELVKETAPLEIVEYIFGNLADAQKIKGTFSLEDCRALVLAKRYLQDFFGKGKEEAPTDYVLEDALQAHGVLRSAVDLQQKTGVFTIEGSADLLNAFDLLRKAISAALPPPTVS